MTVLISPGTNIASTITANPTETVFQLQDGIHRLTAQIGTLRAGLTIQGQSLAAILSGARELHSSADATIGSFVADGATGRYKITGQTQGNTPNTNGTCLAGFPECHQPEDLWLDDVLQVPQTLVTDVTGPGKWFFDYAANVIYIWGSPASKQVETSVQSTAMNCNVDNVTLSGFTIEKYASPFQNSALEGDDGGHNWILSGMLFRDVHGIAVRLNFGWQILGGRITRCGQLGFGTRGLEAGVKPTGIVVDGVEIDNNGVSGCNPGFAAGGCKLQNTDGAIVRNCHVHDNPGMGLWGDIDNEDLVFESNLVEDNGREGLFAEIGYGIKIRFNTVRRCGFGRDNTSGFGAGILVAATTDAEVYGNTVEDCHNGITAVQQDRGSGVRDGVTTLHVVENLYVHDNTVKLLQTSGDAQRVGLWVGWVPPAPDLYTGRNNRFAANHYDLSGADAAPFRWNNANLSFAQWQAAGQDLIVALTRFYFDSTAIPAIHPTLSSEWEALGAGDQWRVLNRSKQGSAYANRFPNSGTTLGEDVLWRSYVYTALGAQTLGGLVKGMLRVREPNVAADARMQCRIKVMDATGTTLRGVLLEHDAGVDDPPAGEFNSPSNLQARKLPRGWTGAGIALSSVAAQKDDLLVIEIGWRHMEAGTIRAATVETGDPVADADLPEGDETNLVAGVGWIEFDSDIIAAGGGSLATAILSEGY